jgi:uncharacterized protein (TIGR02265 family)
MKVKGNVLLARRSFVKKHFGDGAWSRVLESLPAEDKTLPDGYVANVCWYPFEVGKRLDEAVVEVCGRGSKGVFEEIGAASARENLGGVHKDFLAPGNPRAFMDRTPFIYSFYYDTGRREWVPEGPSAGIMTTQGADTTSEFDCLTVVGWYKEALKMCGAKTAEVKEVECRATGGSVCKYRVEWKQ